MIVEAEDPTPGKLISETATPTPNQPVELPPLTANQAQVRRILQSKAFRTSEVHRNLLHYLAEKSLSGEGDGLKEYTVGLDVFSKPESYDPRQESVVRMHMARLRQKLGEYYRTEGLEDPVLVDLPKGGFKITFEPRAIAAEVLPAEPVAAPVEIPEERSRIPVLAWALGGLLLVAAGLATYFGVRLTQVQKTVSATSASNWTPELRELWAPLISSDRPLVVVLATEQSGNAPIGTANGAFLLGQFFSDRKQNVYLTGSDVLTMPEISMGNVVYLGSMSASRTLAALPVKQEFALEAKGVRNLRPQSGEAEFYEDSPHKQGSIEESYALVTHAPEVNRKGDVLALSGNHVSSVTAGVEAFTDPTLARNLVMRLRKPGGALPRFYQIVLKIKSMDETPIDVTYVTHRELLH